jgi:hypothetical protein
MVLVLVLVRILVLDTSTTSKNAAVFYAATPNIFGVLGGILNIIN